MHEGAPTYPLPKDLNGEIVWGKEYLTVPEFEKELSVQFSINNGPGRIAMARQSGAIPMVDSASGEIRFPAPSQRSQQTTISLRVQNSHQEDMRVVLFDAYSNMTMVNYGNQHGVNVNSNVPGLTYSQYLSALANVSCEIGMIRIEVAAGSNELFSRVLTHRQMDITGFAITRPVRMFISPTQQQSNVVEIIDTFPINGFTAFEINVPANTAFTIDFFMNSNQ